MTARLFVGVLGNRNSGKSKTWNTLFGGTVRTGSNARTIHLYDDECVEVFLISGSPEERHIYAGDIIGDNKCRIVLCSIQYIEHVHDTLDFAVRNKFDLFVHWLNPGFSDIEKISDRLNLVPWLLDRGATVAVRDGRALPEDRTEEIRQFIYGWAKAQGLTFQCS